MKSVKLETLSKWAFFLLLLFCLYMIVKLKTFLIPIVQIVFVILIPFIVAGFIAYLLHPLVEKLHKWGMHRGISILLIYFLFFGGIGYGVYIGLPLIIAQLKELSEQLPYFSNQYRLLLEKIYDSTATFPDGVQDHLEHRIDKMEEIANAYLGRMIQSLVVLINWLFALAIIPFVSFYLLKDFEQVKKAGKLITPTKWRESCKRFIKDLDASLGSYIRGQMLVCLALSIISIVVFFIIRLKYPVLLGIIIGLTDIIPYFGPIIGAVPAVLIAATLSTKKVIIVCIVVFILQFIEGNILSPFIVGRSLRLHPIFIIFSLVAGGEIGGVVGMLLAVPTLAVVKVCIIHISRHWKQAK